MPGGVSHAFFAFFWPISLISSRWAHEVAPQVLAWVVCSKPSCFTRFWAGSGCWVAVPVARRVPQGAPKEGQEALWDSAVGRKGSPKRAPCCRDSLFWEFFGAPWGVWGGSRTVLGVPVCASRPSGCSGSCPVGPRLASAGSRDCCFRPCLRLLGPLSLCVVFCRFVPRAHNIL